MEKSGIKTSEFWISILLFVLGIAVLIVDTLHAGGSPIGKVVAGAVSLAAVLGYSIPRAGVKKRFLEASAVKALDKTPTNPS